MKSSIFETLPKNIAIIRKKIKDTNNENENKVLEENENIVSFAESEEEKVFLKNKIPNIKKNPKLYNLITNSNQKLNSDKIPNRLNKEELKEHLSPDLHYSQLSNTEEDVKILNYAEKKNIFNTLDIESIDILKNNRNYSNSNNFNRFNENSYINNNRYFNIGQADNFSILNSYDLSLLNTNQKLSNDFFAESNVSFKNSFLKNMKFKTTFRNMRIIKNSFSQSSIHMNENFGDISRSNNNFYRNSLENMTLNNRKSILIFKNNINYTQNNNFNVKDKIYKNNNEIFHIDEEKDYEEMPKQKSINNAILNNLNKNIHKRNDSLENVSNINKMRLDLISEEQKDFPINLREKRKTCDAQTDVNFISSNDNLRIGSDELINLYSKKKNEKSIEYRLITEIIENIHSNHDTLSNRILSSSKKKSNEYINYDRNNKHHRDGSNQINLRGKKKFERDIPEKVNKSIDIQNQNNSLIFQKNSSDDLLKRIMKNNNYKVEDLVLNQDREKNITIKAKRNKDLSLDSKDSLFETKILKFNINKNKINFSVKKKPRLYSNASELKSIKLDKIDDGIVLKKVQSINSKFQIHRNYNLSIINRRERIINKDEIPLNKGTIDNLSLISEDDLKYKKKRNKDKFDLSKKIIEENKKIPEFSVINIENQNIILKNKLEYTIDKFDFSRSKTIDPLKKKKGRFEMKSLFGSDIKKIDDKLNIRNFGLEYSISNKNSGNPYKNTTINSDLLHLRSNLDIGVDTPFYDNKKESPLKKINLKKLSKKANDIITNNNQFDLINTNSDNSNSNTRNYKLNYSIDKNHFKVQNHAVIKAITEIQKENLELIKTKITDYVQEYNKRFTDFTFKKKRENFIETNEYKENMKKMRQEILNINP